MIKELNYDNINIEDEKKILFFEETGIAFNIHLKKSVDNDRIISYDKEGNKTIYPSLSKAVDILSKDKKNKINLKSRIRRAIIEQSNVKIKGKYWEVNQEDYLKRI